MIAQDAAEPERSVHQEQGFFEKNYILHLLLLLLLFLVFFLFLHFREHPFPSLELNVPAPETIESPLAFEFQDEAATLVLQRDLTKRLGPVYRLSHRALLDWEKTQQSNHGEEKDSQRELLRLLSGLRFTDANTKRALSSLAMPQIQPLTISLEPFPSSLAILKEIEQAVPPPLHALLPSLTDPLLATADLLEEDVQIEQGIKRKIEQEVDPQVRYLPPGSRIIEKGELVNARHLAMLHGMKKATRLQASRHATETLLGTVALTALFFAALTAYLKTLQPLLFWSNRKLSLIILLALITLGLTKCAEFLLVHTEGSLGQLIRYPVFIPFIAFLLSYLINPATATFIAGGLALLSAVGLLVPWDLYLLANLAPSLMMILCTRSMKHRDQIFFICFKGWVCAVLLLAAYHLYQHSTPWEALWANLLTLSVFMLIIAIFIAGCLPFLETGFHIMTDLALAEYIDPTQPLLRRLMIEAPGTYQHSVVVGGLAEAAALAIRANGLFCRVATLYHDVGKIVTSQYFTENQEGTLNIHQLLTPEESAQAIMTHISEGVLLAREADLPEAIIDVIKEHHGTTLVYYFYRKALEAAGGDASKIDERRFRYGGPKPRSKEACIIMIADSFEAAARSLDYPDERSLTQLIDRLVKEKMDDGQFDRSLLTFDDLGKIKRSLVATLLISQHARIKYPLPTT